MKRGRVEFAAHRQGTGQLLPFREDLPSDMKRPRLEAEGADRVEGRQKGSSVCQATSRPN